MDRNSPLRDIKGVGAKTEELFHKIGVYTVGDILLHYPRTYIQYPQAKHVDEVSDGEQAAVLGRITRTPVVRKVRTMQITVTTISEMGVSLELVWYRMPYMKNNLKVGSTYIFYGKVNKKNGRLVMEQAAMFTEEESDKLTFLARNAQGDVGFGYNKEWYDSSVDMKFEDMDIAVPCGHDDILTMLYGDYKVPVCNTSSHNYPFYAKQKEFLLENGYEV